MGTSLSGLTPATTFDGLLKTSDNEPLDGTLKTIGTGDGTDSILQLSNSALHIGGATTIVGGGNDATTTALLVQNTDGTTMFRVTDDKLTTARFRFVTEDTSGNASSVFYANGYGAAGKLAWFNSKVSISDSPANNTAKLQIKGSGATSATTSLLVQNSAGSDLFKVTDDGATEFGTGGGLKINFRTITGAANSNKSIEISDATTYSTRNGHIFKTYDGTAYIEAMRINGVTNPFVGIGETTPTARLHVKGSGATSATTSLLVQNSTGDSYLSVKDNGEFFAGTGYNRIVGSGNNLYLDFIALSYRIGAGNTVAKMTTAGLQIGNGASNPTARLQVKGSGNDATTTALLVQNSAGTTLFDLKDSGLLSSALNMSNNNVVKFNGQNALRGSTTANEVTIAEGFNFQNTIIDDSQLTVKGRGATSATTALLVENSAGTDLLKVNDAGVTTANSLSVLDYLLLGQMVLRYDTIYRGNNASGVLQVQNDSLSFSSTSGVTNDASAMFQLESTTKGFLPPRMTTTERDAITTPAAGLMVYNTTTNKAQCYNGTAWQDLF